MLDAQNKKAAGIALCLTVAGVLLYILLHDSATLLVFFYIKNTEWIEAIAVIRSTVIQIYPRFFQNYFVKNHLVDLLWFMSLCLWIRYLCGEYTYIHYGLLAGMGLLSEGLQFIFPHLGTFDWYDVLLYTAVVLFFFIKQVLTQKR